MLKLMLICFLALPFTTVAQDFIPFTHLLEVSLAGQKDIPDGLEQIEWNAQPEEVESALEQSNISFNAYRAHEKMPKTSFKHGDWKVSIYYNEKGIAQVQLGKDLRGEENETMAQAEELSVALGTALEGAQAELQQEATGSQWQWKSKQGSCTLMYNHSSGSASLLISCQKTRR